MKSWSWKELLHVRKIVSVLVALRTIVGLLLLIIAPILYIIAILLGWQFVQGEFKVVLAWLTIVMGVLGLITYPFLVWGAARDVQQILKGDINKTSKTPK